MRNIRHRFLGLSSLVLVLLLTGAVNVFAQDNKIPNGEKVKKMKGIVVKRDSDWFTMTETTGGPITTATKKASSEDRKTMPPAISCAA